MTDLDIPALEAAMASIGPLPVDPSWMYAVVRHCQRNMDLDVEDGFNEPDQQCGASIGHLVNAAPALIAAAKENAVLRRALEHAGTSLGRFIMMIGAEHPGHGARIDAMLDRQTIQDALGAANKARTALTGKDINNG